MRISDWSSDGCSSNLFGALGLGGVVALLLGMAILIDVEAPGFRLSWAVVGTAGLMSLALLTLLLGYVVRARRAPAHGRASCRDSGCLSASEQVVAVTLPNTRPTLSEANTSKPK